MVGNGGTFKDMQEEYAVLVQYVRGERILPAERTLGNQVAHLETMKDVPGEWMPQENSSRHMGDGNWADETIDFIQQDLLHYHPFDRFKTTHASFFEDRSKELHPCRASGEVTGDVVRQGEDLNHRTEN